MAVSTLPHLYIPRDLKMGKVDTAKFALELQIDHSSLWSRQLCGWLYPLCPTYIYPHTSKMGKVGTAKFGLELQTDHSSLWSHQLCGWLYPLCPTYIYP